MRHAFSLVELSIVLVILGLLAGGIVSGQALMKSSELKAIINDEHRYEAAIASFRDKYKQLPGDLTTATDFWGAANATPATCITISGLTKATCNGNGDGIILGTTYSEQYHAWKQLANAGLIEGQYTGITGGSGVNYSVAGGNTPAGKITNSGYGFSSLSTGYRDSTDANLYEGDYSNALTFGVTLLNNTYISSTALKPEDAESLDRKNDDGDPGTGNIRTRKDFTNCVTSTDPTAATYNATYKSAACPLIFMQAGN